MAKHRKKIYLINRDFQFRYTKAAILVGGISTILTTVVILYPLYQFEILRIPRFLPLPILSAMSIAVLINICFVAMMGIVITHKIAGPMYSIVRYIRFVGQGDFTKMMRIREDDDLKYLVRNFNDMIEQLGYLTKDDLKLLEEMTAHVERNKSSLGEEFAESFNSFKERVAKRVGQ